MKKILFILLLLVISSCATNKEVIHGNMIRDEDLLQVELGMTSKVDMIRLLGQPTVKSSIGEETWYYIGQIVKYESFLRPELENRKIIEIKFDKRGLVDYIQGYDLSDREDIVISDDETKSLGTEKTLLQNLVGNIGKFNSRPNFQD